MGIEVAIIGLVLAGAGAKMQHDAAKDAAKEQEEIANQKSAASKQRRIEERRAAFRKRRIAAARIQQMAEGTGTGESSAETGALSSIDITAANTRGSINANEQIEQSITNSQNRLAEIGVDSSKGAAISSIGSSIFQAGGGFGAFTGGSGTKAPVEEGVADYTAKGQ